jgi:hypothetical protein
MAEVDSTFGETRNYWLSAANQLSSTGSRVYRCPKAIHVSPFMPMELDLFGGNVAFGEAWMEGDWSAPGLVAVGRFDYRFDCTVELFSGAGLAESK